jgi:hypothetical protein
MAAEPERQEPDPSERSLEENMRALGMTPAPLPSPMLEAMIAVHELYLAAVAAGFSEYQACVMLGSWMAATGQGGSGSSG